MCTTDGITACQDDWRAPEGQYACIDSSYTRLGYGRLETRPGLVPRNPRTRSSTVPYGHSTAVFQLIFLIYAIPNKYKIYPHLASSLMFEAVLQGRVATHWLIRRTSTVLRSNSSNQGKAAIPSSAGCMPASS